MALELTIKVDSAYSDGHESQRVENLAVEPFADVEELWEQLQEFTGDGHGTDSSLGYCYEVTVLAFPQRSDLVGRSYEWAGA
jgi:hypothetical protein